MAVMETSIVPQIDEIIQLIQSTLIIRSDTQQEESKINISMDCENISTCEHFNKFINIMNIYYATNIDKINILSALNNYVHLLDQHATDEEFEYISNALGVCDIKTCNAFRRNYRDRNQKEKIDPNITYLQILDKMHCFFVHSLDIGHRLSLKDKIIINQEIEPNVIAPIPNEHKIQDSTDCLGGHGLRKFKTFSEFGCDVCDNDVSMNSIMYGCRLCNYDVCNDCYTTKDDSKVSNITSAKDSAFYEYFINHTFKKMTKIISKNLEIFRNAKRIRGRMKNKYLTLNLKNTENADVKMYNFGVFFLYGYDEENLKVVYNERQTVVDIRKKYSSLKEELLTNDISILNMKQYQNEYKKATIHFVCYYRKQKYPHLLLKYLLSLMIYCNYDMLQYQFSKTYRENVERHCNFYHFGKYLKIATAKCGTGCYQMPLVDQLQDPNLNPKLYHGVSDKMIFPETIGARTDGVYIACPLSTSTSVEVAANFTDGNKGVIVEFEINPVASYGSSKAFSLAWLSDYASEKENLFVQNTGALRIKNITEPKSGMEYSMILRALNMIEDITSDGAIKYHDSEVITNTMRALIIKIIHHQLSYKLSDYKPFHSLSEYAKALINIHFANKTEVYLDCSIDERNEMIYKIFGVQNDKMVNVDLVMTLWPNVEEIDICNSNINSLTLDTILLALSKNGGSRLKEICINTVLHSKILGMDELCKYKNKMEKCGFNMILKPGNVLRQEESEYDIDQQDYEHFEYGKWEFNVNKLRPDLYIKMKNSEQNR
eukprot:96033_1